jgi:hypothetical protein
MLAVQEVGNLELERQVSTLVLAHLAPIEPDRSEVIDRPEVQVPGSGPVRLVIG